MSPSTLSTTLAAATYVDVPVPPHQHLLYHDPAEWDPACCACQNQSLARLFFDEGCSACRAQRDQDRPYVVVEWAVRHPSGSWRTVYPRAWPAGQPRSTRPTRCCAASASSPPTWSATTSPSSDA